MPAWRLTKASLNEALKQEVEQGKLAGTVVLVARKGKLVYADAVGFQDKEEGKPALPERKR